MVVQDLVYNKQNHNVTLETCKQEQLPILIKELFNKHYNKHKHKDKENLKLLVSLVILLVNKCNLVQLVYKVYYKQVN